MLLESVQYTRPQAVQEALQALADNEEAAPLAGGQSLINVLKNRVASVGLLVDVSHLQELRGIRANPDGSLEIGASVTYDELDHSPEARRGHAVLADVAGEIEDQQIRNRGTIGGNCCLGDPINNLPPVLIALGATMKIQGRSGIRQVPADQFFFGYFVTAVEQGELLVSITVPALPPGAGVGYNSLSVGKESKAIVRASAYVRGDGTIQDARVVLGAVGPAPIRHAGMEELLRGAPATGDTVSEASEAIGEDIEPVSDAHGDGGLSPQDGSSRRASGCPRGDRERRRGAMSDAGTVHPITVNINGERYERTVLARQLLVHFIRDTLGLKGTHIGCDTGNCGACTVILNGKTIKSCMMLAAQADSAEIETVEGLAEDGQLASLQRAFHEHHALQCGYCTPGMLMSATYLLRTNPDPTDEEVRRGIRGNICRCTGYVHIVEAIRAAAGTERAVAGKEATQ